MQPSDTCPPLEPSVSGDFQQVEEVVGDIHPALVDLSSHTGATLAELSTLRELKLQLLKLNNQ